MTFDTLDTARALKEAGIEERQAEAIASGIKAASESGHGGPATKADLERAVNRMLLAQITIAAALLAAIKLLP